MPGSLFPDTRSSIVLALGSDEEPERARAFGVLVAVYWKPLYKYVRAAHSFVAADAEDLTQSFLARALERNALAGYDSAKASFRTFLAHLVRPLHRERAEGGVAAEARGRGAAPRR